MVSTISKGILIHISILITIPLYAGYEKSIYRRSYPALFFVKYSKIILMNQMKIISLGLGLFISLVILLACNETAEVTEKPLVKSSTQSQETKGKSIKVNSEPSFQASGDHTYSWMMDASNNDILADRIEPPAGFIRAKVKKGSFAAWLRELPVKEEGARVKLFDKSMKWNQRAQHTVVEMDVDPVDLQQCADAVMRLKAEYHYSKKEFNKIHFNFTSGHRVAFDDWSNGKHPRVSGNKVSFVNTGKKGTDYKNFRKYLRQIFSYAGTASLTKELKKIQMKDIVAGDVFIQGGFPGHAVLVLDVVENERGEKKFLLGQSYMPAQDFHVLKNPNSRHPWYSNQIEGSLETPEWTFELDNLKRFN